MDDAQWALEEAFRTLETYPTERVRHGTMSMLARQMIETEEWGPFDHNRLTDADSKHTALQLAAGFMGAQNDAMFIADAALGNIKDARERLAKTPSTAYMARIASVEEKELEAAMALARGHKDAAEQFLIEATAIEAELNAPSGPPLPMKPSFEMYGEFLIGEGRLEEAAVQFKKALERTPNRTKSVRGLEKATTKSSDTALLQ